MAIEDQYEQQRRYAERVYFELRLERECDCEPGGYEPGELERLKNSLDCANCGNETNQAMCTDYCRDFTGLIRSVRRGLAEDKPDDTIVETMTKKLQVFSGAGYPKNERRLSQELKLFIMNRDNGLCQICKVEPATEIDHILGSSSDSENLRAACGRCNTGRREMVVATDADKQAEIRARRKEFITRVNAVEPMKLCDDPNNWQASERQIRSNRKTKQDVRV